MSSTVHGIDLKQVGLRIKARREFLRLSQEDLAERSRVTRVTISNWERGIREIGILDLPQLVRALGVPTDYLFGNIDAEEAERWNLAQNYEMADPQKKRMIDRVLEAMLIEDRPPYGTVLEGMDSLDADQG